MSKLQSIKLESLKGATNEIVIDFEPRTNLTVIYGENGTGKTSIVDAFDIVCNNKIGSLETKSVGTQKGKYLIALRKRRQDFKVSLQYHHNQWQSSLGNNFQPTTIGPDNKPRVSILWREKIQEFISAQPNKRYEAIKSFIETPKCERTENLINELKKSNEENLENSTNALVEAEEALKNLWQLEGQQNDDYLTWAQSKISRSTEELESEISRYKNIIELTSSTKSKKQIFDNTVNSVTEVAELFNATNREFENKAVGMEQNISLLIDLLNDAEKYIELTNVLENCPVCEQSVQRGDLLERVKSRLTSKSDLVILKNDLIRLEGRKNSAQTQLQRYQDDYIESASKLYRSVRDFTPQELVDNQFQISEYSALDESSQNTIEEKIEVTSSLLTKIEESITLMNNKKDELIANKNQINAITNHLNTIEQKRNTAEHLALMKNKITELYDIFVEERQLYVKRLLELISDDIDRMYSNIHPNENIGRIKLTPERRASIELKAMFENQDDILPQAYYSESHLDTLGICLFIALAKLFRDEDTILIFDDVITSADQIHLTRFLRMLEGELGHFQHTIITTHYQVWRDKYRYGGGNNVQTVELLRWTFDRGIRHTKTKLYIEELNHYLSQEPMDKQIVASKSGIFLELILDNLALMYRCKLPRKADPFYTLGEFMGAFDSSLKRRLKVEIVNEGDTNQEIQLASCFNVLPEDSQLRNEVGCHFNTIGEHFSEDDIRILANNTITFADALICADCGEFPYRKRSGSYYECGCSKKRLHPFAD
ncbi:MAG: AAA family ATPase [Ignavibacterium sp.]|nr:AAA family ATPase [Ignavibacterium sp.]